jgi:phytoene desaturase
MSKIAIIGSGFSGLSAACYVAAQGHEVHVFEKNATCGGRARQFKTDNGFVFDMGPSWYWMPDVFERFFADFGHKVSDFYELTRLDPAFDIIFPEKECVSIPDSFEDLCALFDRIEPGSSKHLELFMKDAEEKYRISMKDLVYKPSLSAFEFIEQEVLSNLLKMNLFSSFSKHTRKYFKDPRLIALMEFPVLFLGAMPQDTPALYSMMNYAGLKMGTWYPKGGFGKVVESFVELAKNLGVHIHVNAKVEKINVHHTLAESLLVNGEIIPVDGIIAAADYQHVEDSLLDTGLKNYSNSYWENKTFAPSCLVVYVGLNKRVDGLKHHTLFFDEDLNQHAHEIYKNIQYPSKPLFYVSCTSKSDKEVAPEGQENLFLLMPLAPGLKDSEEQREKYFNIMLDRLEAQLDQEIRSHIIYKKTYCIQDYINDYNSYKGNAYGLANTLMQTAFMKPKIVNKKVKNLVYAGQLTVPGPVVPPAIISGKIASQMLHKKLTPQYHETVV